MRKVSFGLIMVCFVVAFSSCSKKPLHHSKVLEASNEKPVAGSLQWIDRLQYNDDHKISYGYFNDENDLVIRTMVRDKNTLMKIFATGFTIQIDTCSKKKPQFSVKYPLAQGGPNRFQEGNSKQSMKRSPDRNGGQHDLQAKYKTALNSIELVGFNEDDIQKAELNTRDGEGITAWILVDSTSTMYYELRIPLTALAISGRLSQNMISIGLESGALDLPSDGPGRTGKAGVSMQPSGGRSQGQGGGRGGQGDGRPGGNTEMRDHMADRQALSQEIDIWVKRIELQ